MTALLKRNNLLFFKNKANVFFSFLGVIIVLLLFILFLGNSFSSNFTNLPNWRELKFSWLTAGIVSMASFTTALGAFNTVVADKEKKLNKGFYASPITRGEIMTGYILNGFVVSILMSGLLFIIMAIYLVIIGSPMGFLSYLQVFGILLISSLMNTTVLFFVISFIKSDSVYSTITAIIGTTIGFLLGIYFPIGGGIPVAVQTIIKLFPPSHSAILLRQIIMEEPIRYAFTYHGPEGLSATRFEEIMGVIIYGGDRLITPWMSIGYILIALVIFGVLSFLRAKSMGRR